MNDHVENTADPDKMPRHFVGLLAEGNDKYITGMEAAGQRQLVAAEGLMPAEGDWDALRALGFGEPEPTDDPLFVKTTLPSGWTKGATPHDMHSSVLDERGVERVNVFYKAAFYDRRASCHVIDAGRQLGIQAIYGDGPIALPDVWDKLTRAEQMDFTRELVGYLIRAEEHPDIYGKLAPRAEALRKLAIAS